MAERKRIGLIFCPNKNWMGGVYYILNLINALNTLPDERKPVITLLCRSAADFEMAKDYTRYPYLDYRPTFSPNNNYYRRIINKVSRILTGDNIIAFHKINECFDIIYPLTYKFQLQSKSPVLYWIPDFQELHLPDFFSSKELHKRNKGNKSIVNTGKPVVLSSYDALKDFNEFYPESNKSVTHVFHFASSIPHYDMSKRDSIMKKFKINGPFFFCANQFWVHKNHLTLFKAVGDLKKQGKDILVICSGNLSDYRNPQYCQSLIDYVNDNGLTENIKFLGLIEREELVCLMKESIAVVQPSLFEGWNTSIEEAKALNKYIVASDLPLHKEQVEKNVRFFDPHSSTDLAIKLWEVWTTNPLRIDDIDYEENIRKAGEDFMKIIESTKNN